MTNVQKMEPNMSDNSFFFLNDSETRKKVSNIYVHHHPEKHFVHKPAN